MSCLKRQPQIDHIAMMEIQLSSITSGFFDKVATISSNHRNRSNCGVKPVQSVMIVNLKNFILIHFPSNSRFVIPS